MFEPNIYDTSTREPKFYLARILGPTMSMLVVMLVLYASIRHQLLHELRPAILHLGFAHLRAVFQLTLFGEPDTISVFAAGHKTYLVTRLAIAKAGLFVESWQAILWRIEVGTVEAIGFVLGPRAAWLFLAWVISSGPDRRPMPALETAPVSVPSIEGWRKPGDLEERPVTTKVAPLDDERKAPEPGPAVTVMDANPLPNAAIEVAQQAPQPVTITTPTPLRLPAPIEPGQVRKRPRPEA